MPRVAQHGAAVVPHGDLTVTCATCCVEKVQWLQPLPKYSGSSHWELRSFDLFKGEGSSEKLFKMCREVPSAVSPTSVQTERDYSIVPRFRTAVPCSRFPGNREPLFSKLRFLGSPSLIGIEYDQAPILDFAASSLQGPNFPAFLVDSPFGVKVWWTSIVCEQR